MDGQTESQRDRENKGGVKGHVNSHPPLVTAGTVVQPRMALSERDEWAYFPVIVSPFNHVQIRVNLLLLLELRAKSLQDWAGDHKSLAVLLQRTGQSFSHTPESWGKWSWQGAYKTKWSTDIAWHRNS